MANELERIPESQLPAPRTSAPYRPPEPPPADLRTVARAVVVRRGLVLGILAAVVVAVGLYSFLAPPMYECRASLLVQSDNVNLSLATEAGLGTLLGGGSGPSVETELAILNSKQLVERAVRRSGLSPERRSDWLLEARDVNKTAVVRVVARAHSVAKARLLCTNAVAEYLECTRRLNREAAGTAARFVQGQAEEAERKLVAAQERLRSFKEQTGTIALDVETKERVSRLAEIGQQLEQAKAEQAAAQAQARRVKSLLAEQAPTVIASSNIGENPVVSQLQQTLTELETKRAEALQEYVPTSSTVRTLDGQIADTRRRLAGLAREHAETVIREQHRAVNPIHQSLLQTTAELAAAQSAGLARIQALGGAVKNGEQELASLPEREFQLAQLMREVETYAKTFGLLTAKYQELRINEEAEVANARVLEQPKALTHRVTPRRGLNLALALMLGLLLGVGAALLADHFGASLPFSDRVPEHLGTGVLGHVRAVPEGSGLLLPDLHSGTELAEDYRRLRASVALAPGGASLQALLVTSPGSGEGKSVTAINLATAFARQGRRVLVVDSDLRRPSLHEKLGLPGGMGLAEVFVGKAGLEAVIRETTVPNLHLLPAGEARAEAVDLLEVGRLRALLAELRTRYDLVVLDSPPALGIPDAQLLARAADGVLVVVGSPANRHELARMRQLMAFIQATVIGAVVNRVDFSRQGRLDRYLQYYAGYPGEPEPPTPRSLPPSTPQA